MEIEEAQNTEQSTCLSLSQEFLKKLDLYGM